MAPRSQTTTGTSPGRVNQAVNDTLRIAGQVEAGSSAWSHHVNDALEIVHIFEGSAAFARIAPAQRQTAVTNALQNIAFYDPDRGSVREIAEWCSEQWLRLLSQDHSNIAALTGLGRSWFWRAQPALSRIHISERSSSSSGDSSTRSGHSYFPGPDSDSFQETDEDVEIRVSAPDYIEARTALQPAIEYLERAVAAATAQGLLTNDLTSLAAEANMSFGNVTRPRDNERFFRRAVSLLRLANDRGFTLSSPLRQYLDDYGRYVG